MCYDAAYHNRCSSCDRTVPFGERARFKSGHDDIMVNMHCWQRELWTLLFPVKNGEVKQKG
jgi:hypothetical protein